MANNPNYKSRSRKQAQGPTPEQAVVEGLFRGIGQVISWIFKSLSGKSSSGGSNSQKEFIVLREHWENVEMHALQEATGPLAVSEADKILDSAFIAMGFAGTTMADRLKAAEKWFTPELYQEIWDAHKLRNTLAHQVGAHANSEQVRKAVDSFRRALYSLGVLS